jgi:hypothetical protein
MDDLDLKRCRHCVAPVATITPDEHDGFVRPWPACICLRCDRRPHPEDATFVPAGWDLSLP